MSPRSNTVKQGPLACREASVAAIVAEKRSAHSVRFDDCGAIEKAVALLGEEALSDAVGSLDAAIGEVKDGAAVYATWEEENFSVAKAAKRLGMHANTVRNRIEALSGQISFHEADLVLWSLWHKLVSRERYGACRRLRFRIDVSYRGAEPFATPLLGMPTAPAASKMACETPYGVNGDVWLIGCSRRQARQELGRLVGGGLRSQFGEGVLADKVADGTVERGYDRYGEQRAGQAEEVRARRDGDDHAQGVDANGVPHEEWMQDVGLDQMNDDDHDQHRNRHPETLINESDEDGDEAR